MSIAQNIANIRDRIAQAAHRANRPPEEITLMAVTKTVEPARIREAFGAGIRVFGENRVQEFAAKAAGPDRGVVIRHRRRRFAEHRTRSARGIGHCDGRNPRECCLRLIGHGRTRRASKAQRSTARAGTHAAETALQHFRNFASEIRQRPISERERCLQ